MVRTHLDRAHQKIEEDEPEKYFHESSFHEHYDGRFADKQVNYQDKHRYLRMLIQTYLSTMNDIGAETWIMHGTLLGWWWNKRIMPWDSDIDVMMSENSMHHLALYYNMSVHHYRLSDSEQNGRDYLLEINPHYTNDSIDNSNKIDARWIDTDTGLFIDITTLRRNTTAEALGDEGAMMVKDNHHFYYDDIFPLRETVFESFPAKVPYSYADILIEEYGEEALSRIIFENHFFNREKKTWAPVRYSNLRSGLRGGTSNRGREIPR
ncbi:hypothetical protein M433DRAFT_8715 [Acidomyces richmondensis BFW]|nr:MAG: hypothetical protein FE78DRAFT_28334 [Acidomyces sp. 'richmondensis']KYG40530.1 hypothetical protein M433DRAFT_8715 [Acidomyces richmondensis BFW]